MSNQTLTSSADSETWSQVITPRHSLFDLKLDEVWRYRDLLLMFVKRDFVTFYKQTILGPIWFFIQPIFTTLVYVVVFGRLANISTDSIPPILFYLAGITAWNYYADVFQKTSDTFKGNQQIFGKVYFPRLVVPLSIVISNLIKFFIQLSLFLVFWTYYLFQDAGVQPTAALLLFPLLVIMMAGLGMGSGMIITSLTTKYRDLTFLLQFAIQLLMYATPVIYPLSTVPEKYQWLVVANPMTAIIETLKYGFLGAGTFRWDYLGYSFTAIVIILLAGVVIFNKTEKNFMDTV